MTRTMPPFDPSLTSTDLTQAPLVAAEEILGGRPQRARPVVVEEAPAADAGHPAVVAHRALRRAVFVEEQGLFSAAGDLDDADADPSAVVLVARDAARSSAECAWRPPRACPPTSAGGPAAGSPSPPTPADAQASGSAPR